MAAKVAFQQEDLKRPEYLCEPLHLTVSLLMLKYVRLHLSKSQVSMSGRIYGIDGGFSVCVYHLTCREPVL